MDSQDKGTHIAEEAIVLAAQLYPYEL